MPATVERLRLGLVLVATALLVVLLAFFLLSRWRDRFTRRDLPQRLGLNIQQDSNGFTLSKSEHGQTLFTLHAGRAVQLKNGAQATLHDVQIVLYGQGESRRRDAIRGENFLYDPKTQIVTSQGVVTIDLQGPGAGQDSEASTASIHLRTTGLVFDQATGHASTAERVDFRLPQLTGAAVGADYDAQLGTIELRNQVRLDLQLDGGAATLDAASGEMLHANSQVLLSKAVLHTRRRDASAAHAVLWMHPDGSADRVTAEGDVRMATPEGMVLTAPRVNSTFNQDSRIRTMNVTGGVKLLQPARDGADGREGSAQSADMDFDALGKARILHMTGNVSLQETRAGPRGWQRSLHAGNVQVAFVQGVASRMTARESPVFEQRDGSADGDKTLKADVLEAGLRQGKVLESLHGTGSTELAQSLPGKETDISTGDTLAARFAPEGSGADGQIQDAVQRGNVRLERRLAPAKGETNGDVLVAYAQQAEYREPQDTVLLTGGLDSGNPRMTDKSEQQAATEIEAQQIELDRATGVAIAEGDVKASYVSNPAAQPAHIVAGHAVMVHSTGTATFTGAPRMWQEGNSVQAPVLVLDQQSQGLTAEAKNGVAVRTVLVDQRPGSKLDQPVRIRSQKLVYSGVTRRARFSTAVTLVTQQGTTRADQADVFFKPERATSPGKPATPGLMSGNIDRIVADGGVSFTQLSPRRQGTGEQLAYTADDGKYLLTGSPGRRPRIEDAQQGTVSGEALQFSSDEERVDVIAGSGRTVTTTRMRK